MTSLPGFTSYGLWNLWAIMEAFKPDRILHLARSLVNTTAIADVRGQLEESYRDLILRDFEALLEECRALGLPVAAKQTEDMLKTLRLGSARHDGIAAARGANMINSTIEIEMSQRLFFFIPSERAKYYESKQPLFGLDVQTKFVSSAYELDEAAKCMAFRRSTASVFHLMRLMELAIKAVSQCLSIPAPTKSGERNWGVILSKIKSEMDRRNGLGSNGWSEREDRDLFADIYVSLDAVRVAWRNTTMHVESKYDSEEAEHIFVAVRGFMRKLASRMDEQGQPTA